MFREGAAGCFWCVLCGVPPGVQQRDVPVLLHNKTGWADHSQKMLSWSAGTESLSPSSSQPSSVSCNTGNCLIWFCSLAVIRWQDFESRRLSALWKQFRFSEWLTHICSPFFSSHSWSDSCSTWTQFWTLTGLDYCLIDPLFLPGQDILKTFSILWSAFFLGSYKLSPAHEKNFIGFGFNEKLKGVKKQPKCGLL